LACQRRPSSKIIGDDAPPIYPVVVLTVLLLLVRYAHIAIPVVSSYSFETLLAAILLLLAGNLFKGF
jgi:hypothetical protein